MAAKKIVDAVRVHNGGHYALALPTTVETYRARMVEKLDIGDFATLVKFEIQRGISSLNLGAVPACLSGKT